MSTKKDHLKLVLMKALILWIAIAIVVSACLSLFPHDRTSPYVISEQLSLVAIGILAWLLFCRERTPKARTIFFSFFLFGVLGQLGEIAVLFIGRNLVSVNKYIEAYTYQYSTIATLFFCCLSVVNSAIVGVQRWSEASIVLTVGLIIVFVMVFGGYFVTPQFLYLHPNITDFRIIDRAVGAIEEKTQHDAQDDEIAHLISLSKWEDGRRVGELSFNEKRKQVEWVLPYVRGSNYTLLLFRPLFKDIVLVSALCIVLLLAFFGFHFVKDPPVGAYLEKIIGPLFFYDVFRYTHYSWYAESTDIEACLQEFNIGSIFSILALVTLGAIFLLRIKFISTSEGRYYEANLERNASNITRWRDGVDNFVLRHFFANGSALIKRFIVTKRKPSQKD